ncbi:MAG: hypothetical protein EAX95_06525 [Candidatus Thorarchaeota archaeon]|nr:hypothetical protein [Candidatus Thorarchaeota archaeon]
MMLSDVDIEKCIAQGEIRIDPLDSEAIGPCSIDLCLDSVFRVYNPGKPVDIRLKEALDKDTKVVDTKGNPFLILPGQFILGQTVERISLSAKYAALLESPALHVLELLSTQQD